MKHKIEFKILIIDDDLKMINGLKSFLEGATVEHQEYYLKANVDYVYIDLQKSTDEEDFWVISKKTLNQLKQKSSIDYQLIYLDYGYTTVESQNQIFDILKRYKSPKIDRELKGKILTVKDLKQQFTEFIVANFPDFNFDNTFFNKLNTVVLRSYTVTNDVLGPVIPERLNNTRACFPNSSIITLDTRQMYFPHEFHDNIYENKEWGRDFYRHFASIHSLEIFKTEAFKTIADLNKRKIVKRTTLNISLYAGIIAMIGILTKLFIDIGLDLFGINVYYSIIFFVLAIIILLFGSLGIALYFESFTQRIIKWIN